MQFGKRLLSILIEAGFTQPKMTVSADVSDGQSVAATESGLLNGPFGQAMIDQGHLDKATRERWIDSVQQWGKRPDSVFANVHIEVIGHKPA